MITTKVRHQNYTFVTVKMKLNGKKVSWTVRVGSPGASTIREAQELATEKAREAFNEIDESPFYTG